MRYVLLLTACLGLALSGCIGDADPGGNARDGGSVVVGVPALPTTIDPALASDPGALQALWLVYTPLLTYRHAEGREGTELIAGLARDLPEISDDGLTYRLRLRRGLRYSNGALVRPGDFERAIERVRALASPLAALYAGIESIDADRASGRITITLVTPDPAFSQVLALPSSAPLPRGTPQTERSTRPLPGVGPYRIQEVRPGRRVVLTRVDDFDVPGVSPGHVDRIALVSRGSPEQQTRAVITGSLDVMQEPAPTDLLPEIRSKYRDSYREEARASTIALVPDSRVAPLDDVAVRRAIGESLGGEEVERRFKGLLTTSCTVVPEILSGFQPAGSCPYDDRDDPSDLVSAREQIDEAGAEDAPLRVVPGPGISGAVARDVVRTLRKIGLAARLRAGEGPELRIERIAPLAVHPAAYLEPLALNVFDEQLSDALAGALEDPEEGWGEVDQRIVSEAYAIPLGSELWPSLFSERIDVDNCARSHPVFGVDLSALCLE